MHLQSNVRQGCRFRSGATAAKINVGWMVLIAIPVAYLILVLFCPQYMISGIHLRH